MKLKFLSLGKTRYLAGQTSAFSVMNASVQ
jgi:hypothetical protein